jgi:hypothetical protein
MNSKKRSFIELICESSESSEVVGRVAVRKLSSGLGNISSLKFSFSKVVPAGSD